MSEPAYVPRIVSETTRAHVRGVDYRVRRWGPVDAPPLVLLHGSRDTAATFQFLVDSLRGTYRVIAPDWRGHGGSSWTPGSYWLSDFLLDLDRLADDLVPGQAVAVVGHSMGGNIAALFAAIRPARVSKLVLLDSLGSRPDQNPVAIADELAKILAQQDHAARFRRYADVAALADRLQHQNRRLDRPRALFLADASARSLPQGGVTWPHDPRFHRSYPTLHSVAEWGACWQRITMPVLALLSSDPQPGAATADAAEVSRRAAFFPDLTVRRVADTGHNLHHDATAVAADAIDAFLRGATLPDCGIDTIETRTTA
ncbi:alpha/beta fold hydrolase [Sphingomonas ginsenosidivorax]|uniref:alpha/beta fold hydrolase n=1 Tax=Sphingomonas ginsenosidivorax TaxID=862135 RepID=UPI0013152B64|nr:alpha/beta hydrolase [Sphingomonas ginsenosidivorax]